MGAILFAYGNGFGEETKREIVVPVRNSVATAIAPIEKQVREMEGIDIL